MPTHYMSSYLVIAIYTTNFGFRGSHVPDYFLAGTVTRPTLHLVLMVGNHTTSRYHWTMHIIWHKITLWLRDIHAAFSQKRECKESCSVVENGLPPVLVSLGITFVQNRRKTLRLSRGYWIKKPLLNHGCWITTILKTMPYTLPSNGTCELVVMAAAQ